MPELRGATPSLDWLLGLHYTELRAMGRELDRIRTRLFAGLPELSPQYAGKSIEQIETLFEEFMVEIEFSMIFMMLSVIEANLRLDFISGRRVGEAFRTIAHAGTSRLDDLIDAWKIERPEASEDFSEFKGALRLRHWLAHGRYWDINIGRAYSPEFIFQLGGRILATLN